VLLIAFGGPGKPEDIRPFLDIVTAGRRISPSRIAEVAHHYEIIGGRSPLTELTMRQAEALGEALHRLGRAEAVYVGMRNWHPFLQETLESMRAPRTPSPRCRRPAGTARFSFSPRTVCP